MSDAQATNSTAQPGHAVDDTQGLKVFAGNLAYAVTDDSLRAFFAPVADDIVSAQVIMRGTRSAGYGFVSVTSLDAVQKACELLDKKELEGRQVVVELAKRPHQKDKERAERRAKRREGRARGKAPPGEVTEAEASGTSDKPADAEDSPTDGDTKPKPKKKKAQKKKAKKPVADGEEPAVAASGEADDQSKPDAAPRKKTPRAPKEKKPPRPAGQDPEGEPSTTVLFVANLGFNIDDAGLSELFSNAGINVVSARVVRKRWGKPRMSKGYGFVDVGGAEEQQKAIAALQGKEIEGRELAVKVAVNAVHDDDEKEGGAAVNGATTPEATVVAK